MTARLFCIRFPVGRAGYADRARAMLTRVRAGADDNWISVTDRMGVLVAIKPDERDVAPLVLPDQLGVVLGRLFVRREDGSSVLIKEVAKAEAFDLVSRGGHALVRSHWGPYCAVLHDRFANTLRIVRDPMGARPLFHTEAEGLSVVFTHVADLMASGLETRIDDVGLRAFLTDVRIVSERTGFEGVSELLAGCELRLGQDGVDVECVWRATQQRRWTGDTFSDAVSAIRREAFRVGDAWAAALPHALHRLSGGLDSSIALALLTRGQERLANIMAINEYSDYPESDERVQARAAAKWFGVPLLERQVTPAQADYAAILNHEPETKPTLAALGFADEGLRDTVGDYVGGPLTSGQGGDQVLHRSSSAAVVADAVRDGMPACDVWRVAYDNALLARRPVWHGIGVAIKYGLLRAPKDGLAQLKSPMIWRLGDAASADAFLLAIWRSHPWNVPRESPARAERVRRIIDLTYYHQASPLTYVFQNTPLLTSQPLVEACLSTAPYLMAAHGQDRALARAAFEQYLPPEVLRRQTKGDTTRFVTEMLRRLLPFARDVLIGGRLEQRGIVPQAVLRDLITPRVGMDGLSKTRLMRSLAAELWVRRVERTQAAANTLSASPG